MIHKSTPPAIHNSDSAAHRLKIRTHILAKSYVDLNKARTVFVVLLWRGYVPTRYCPHLQKLHSWNEYSFAQGKYADKNCTGDSTPDSQPKRHGQEKCPSLDEVWASQNRKHKANIFGRKDCLGPTWRGFLTHARKLEHAMSCKVISINVYTQKARQEPLFEILPERSNALLHNTPNPCPPINSSLEMKYVSLVFQKRNLQQRNNSIFTDQSCLLDVKTLQLFAEDRNSLQKTPTKSKALVICITWIARMNRMHCFATSK